jgi:exosortase A
MTDILQPSTAAVTERTFRSAAGIAISAVLLSLLLLGVIFPSAAGGAVRVWIASPTFNHCFLIVPLTLFMIWQRRQSLDPADISPTVWVAVGVLALSLVWFVISYAAILEAEQFVIITIAEASLFAAFGHRFYGKLAGPFLYLYFLVPSGAFLIPTLQAFTARFAVAGLHLLGIPVFSTGAVIEIPAGTFAIAEACAGLRFLIASVAFGVFFAIVTYRSILRRALFIVLSIIVPIIANGIRALALIAAAEWVGSPTAALADHIIYGWIFFSAVLIILVLIGHIFSDRSKFAGAHIRVAEGSPDFHVPIARLAVVATICILAASPGPLATVVLSAPEPLPLPQSAPRVSLPWRLSEARSEWTPVLARPSRIFSDAFVLGGERVERYVALYAENGRASNLVRSDNRDADEDTWTFDSQSSGELNSSGQRIPVRVSTWLRGSERRIVWSFYVVGGEPLAGRLQAKMEQLAGALSGRNCLAAYIALSMDIRNGTPQPTAPADLLAATEPLSPYLCGDAATSKGSGRSERLTRNTPPTDRK